MDLHTNPLRAKFRIAVIDDEIQYYTSLRGIIEAEHLDYPMSYFDSTENFLDSAKPENFDYIFLDFLFPPGRKTGLDLLKRFAEQNVSTPVIMMTACNKADLPTAFAMRDLGAVHLLMKPFSHYDVLKVFCKAWLPVASVPESPLAQADKRLDLEEINPVYLIADGRAQILDHAQKRLTPKDYGGLATLTLTEMKVFLLRTQHVLTAQKLADSLGMKVSTWNAHVESVGKKLGDSSVLHWRILFDKINR